MSLMREVASNLGFGGWVGFWQVKSIENVHFTGSRRKGSEVRQ